jgi:hypothetical protein
MSGNDTGDNLVRLVSDPRNGAVLTVLNDADRPLEVHELAERLVSHDGVAFGSSRREDGLEGVRISLHHNQLPKLADAGLVEYDHDECVATYRDPAAADAEWLNAASTDELLARFRTASEVDEGAIGVIEGRENVIERGRQLADQADDELFLMYVSDDLLEDGCLDHSRDAVERGVDIYLGSQNSCVRDLTRKHLPEATLWEPQLDWMNVPSRYPKVGRFILADREHVMLAILDEPDPDGTYPEVAVTASGTENPLVVLVRELLGPRLDHLDYQSEEFRSELPF